MTDLDNARAILGEARENMRVSAAKARRRVPSVAKVIEAVTTPALPAPVSKAKAQPQPQPEVSVDLTAIPAFTAEMLAAHTGASLRSIREAIRSGKIRTTLQKKGPALLKVADAAKWLQAKHSITPLALIDIYLQES